jgi:hypothetical protein
LGPHTPAHERGVDPQLLRIPAPFLRHDSNHAHVDLHGLEISRLRRHDPHAQAKSIVNGRGHDLDRVLSGRIRGTLGAAGAG